MESTIFGKSAASGLTGMLRGSASGPSVLPVPKSAGILECAGTSFFKDEIMLDQELTKAFQTGLRHSLDDPEQDASQVREEKLGGIHVSVDGRCWVGLICR